MTASTAKLLNRPARPCNTHKRSRLPTPAHPIATSSKHDIMRLSLPPSTPTETSRSSTPDLVPSATTQGPQQIIVYSNHWSHDHPETLPGPSKPKYYTPNPYAFHHPAKTPIADQAKAVEDRKHYKAHNLRLIAREQKWRWEKAEMEAAMREKDLQAEAHAASRLEEAKQAEEALKSAIEQREVMSLQNTLLHARMVAILAEKNGVDLELRRLKHDILKSINPSS